MHECNDARKALAEERSQSLRCDIPWRWTSTTRSDHHIHRSVSHHVLHKASDGLFIIAYHMRFMATNHTEALTPRLAAEEGNEAGTRGVPALSLAHTVRHGHYPHAESVCHVGQRAGTSHVVAVVVAVVVVVVVAVVVSRRWLSQAHTSD